MMMATKMTTKMVVKDYDDGSYEEEYELIIFSSCQTPYSHDNGNDDDKIDYNNNDEETHLKRMWNPAWAH